MSEWEQSTLVGSSCAFDLPTTLYLLEFLEAGEHLLNPFAVVSSLSLQGCH